MSNDDASCVLEKGDKLFAQGQIFYKMDKMLHAEACYTQAIKLYPNDNSCVYARRSAARVLLGQYQTALEDAEKAISSNPEWSVGYAWKGSALAAMSHYYDALEAYKEALKRDPGNDMLAKKMIRVEELYDYKYKDLIQKLKAEPHTRDWLNDPEYLENVKKIAQGSWYLTSCRQKPDDMRLIYAHSIVSGFDKYLTISGTSEKSTPPPTVCEKLSSEEFYLGLHALLGEDFDNALKHFSQAIEFNPKDTVLYNIKAGVYFKQKEYEKCIKECEKAVKIGRENGAKELIDSAFTMIGDAYKNMAESESP